MIAKTLLQRDDHLKIALNDPGDIRLLETGLPLRDNDHQGGKTRTVYSVLSGTSSAIIPPFITFASDADVSHASYG